MSSLRAGGLRPGGSLRPPSSIEDRKKDVDERGDGKIMMSNKDAQNNNVTNSKSGGGGDGGIRRKKRRNRPPKKYRQQQQPLDTEKDIDEGGGDKILSTQDVQNNNTRTNANIGGGGGGRQRERRNRPPKKDRQQQELKLNSRWDHVPKQKQVQGPDNDALSDDSISKKKYSGNGGRTNTKKRENRQRRKEEDKEYQYNNGQSNQQRAKDAWASVQLLDQPPSPTRNNNKLHVSAKCLSSDSTERVSVNDNTKSYGNLGKALHVRNEWKKIESGVVKSKEEEDMEELLTHLYDTEVGMLLTASANLGIELPDGEGGYINTTQDQLLSEFTLKLMDSWRDKRNWTRDETKLAGQILLRMEKEEILGNGTIVEKQHYLSVINAYASITTEDETASIRAENLLEHIERRYEDGRTDMRPDRLIINTVMGAQAKHSLSGKLSMDSIAASERMLDVLEHEYSRGDYTMQPTARTYSKFIDLYAKNAQPDKAVMALDRMECQYRNGNKAALPRTIHYTSVIDALAKSASKSRDRAGTAEDILRSMLDLYDKGEYHLAPDEVIFSATIDAYAKSGRSDASERSLAILDLMDTYQVTPDIILYNTLLNTMSTDPHRYLCKSKDILHYIEQSPDLRADSFTYNAVIKSCPPEEAEQLIQHWEMEYRAGSCDEKPDSFTYTALIKAWTSSNIIGYEDKCLQILRWMEDNDVVGMNRIAYNITMKAFSHSSREDAGDMAGGVYNQLISRYQRTNDRQFCPDKFTYLTLINAYSRNCSTHETALEAEKVLFDMMESNVIPDNKLCNNVIAAWARSGSQESIYHAEEICNRMDELGINIDGVCFNSLINVYATSNDPERGVWAFKVLDRMKERGVRPTSVTYTILFTACQDDQELLMQVFDSTINDGMLDEKLVGSFKDHGPSCLQEQLREGNINHEWSRHANRGPVGNSRKWNTKRGSTGADVRQFSWAR